MSYDPAVRRAARAMYMYWYQETVHEWNETELFVKRNFEKMFLVGMEAHRRREK